MKQREDGIQIQSLSFSYESSPDRFVLKDLSFELPVGSRTLLVGANGVGKSTLLRILAGFHLVSRDTVRIFGRSPFYDSWPRGSVALLEGAFPLNLDLSLEEVLGSRSSWTARENALFELLEIQWSWRMNRVSDGERRRVQIFIALRYPVRLLLLDEITTHLDLLVRSDLLEWIRRDSEQVGTTVLYTTHILDGLWTRTDQPWPTHLVFLNGADQGGLKVAAPIGEVSELQERSKNGDPAPLLNLCADWMREMRSARA